MKTLIALVVIFIFGKTLLPLITDYFLELFGKKEKNKNSGNIEVMIAQKKRLFETVGAESSSFQESPSKRQQVSLKNQCLERFKDLSKQSRSSNEEKEFLDLKRLMKLMDSFQWGDGPELKKITSNIKSKSSIDIPTSFVSKQIQFLLKENSKEKAFSFSRFINLCENYSFCYYILSQDLKQIMTNTKNDSLNIQNQSISLLYSSFSNLNTPLGDIINDDFSLKTQSEAKLRQVTQTISKQNKLDLILKKIGENSLLINSLAPLPSITKTSSLNDALAIFSLKEIPNEKSLKKTYREYVSIYHPDKFNNYKFNQEIETNIHDNFLSIQAAYDIILDKI